MCTFVMAMIGLFVFDSITNESLALTTPDCRVCHTGDPSYTRPYGAMMPAHHAFNRACGACHKTGVPITTNPDDPGYDCLTCHYPGTIIYNALDVTAAHTPLHNMTDVPAPECNACHLPSVIDEHAKYPLFATAGGELDCDRCHKNSNTDPQLGPINVQENIALGSGPDGQIIKCDQCHTNISGTAMRRPTPTSCPTLQTVRLPAVMMPTS